MMDKIKAWQNVLKKMAHTAENAGRDPKEIRLLAVSKNFPLVDIQTLFTAGQQAFGESYAQELQAKAQALPEAEWHFIGPLQSNKTKIVAQYASWVHSVDRAIIAQRLASQRPTHLPPLNICLQVNISEEGTKQGVEVKELRALAKAVEHPNLRLRGLMGIAEATQDHAKLHIQFAMLREAFNELNKAGFKLDTLSMGMTNDLHIAIVEGSTMVRVGTAIFGVR